MVSMEHILFVIYFLRFKHSNYRKVDIDNLVSIMTSRIITW
jgi:hypothetical protein